MEKELGQQDGSDSGCFSTVDSNDRLKPPVHAEELEDDAEALSPASSVSSAASEASSATSEVSSASSSALSEWSSLASDAGPVRSESRLARHRGNPSIQNSLRRVRGQYNNASKSTAVVDEHLQGIFKSAVSSGDLAALSSLLHRHSESIDVNKYDESGQTPVQHFCQLGDLKCVKLLVRYGADISLRTRSGWSMLHIASFQGSIDMLNFLLKSTKR